jgi:hypothetical protein
MEECEVRTSTSRGPATDGPLRITNAKTKTAGPREHMDFILHLLFASEPLKVVVVIARKLYQSSTWGILRLRTKVQAR